MQDNRQFIERSLKTIAVSKLRDLGFNGSFPHFFRDQDGHIDLASFQFAQGGGRFVVELSFATPNRENVYIYKNSPPAKLRVSQTTKRFRLGSSTARPDHWFEFSSLELKPNALAEQVAQLLGTQGVSWWSAQKNGG